MVDDCGGWQVSAHTNANLNVEEDYLLDRRLSCIQNLNANLSVEEEYLLDHQLSCIQKATILLLPFTR